MPANLRLEFRGSGALGQQEAARSAAIVARALSRMGRPAVLHDTVVVCNGLWDCSDVTVALDEAALANHSLPPAQGLVINSARPARVIQANVAAPSAVVAIDASGIACEEGTDAPAALLGALMRLLPCLNADMLAEALWAEYDRGFGYMARAAVRAFDLGCRQALVATPSTASR